MAVEFVLDSRDTPTLMRFELVKSGDGVRLDVINPCGVRQTILSFIPGHKVSRPKTFTDLPGLVMDEYCQLEIGE